MDMHVQDFPSFLNVQSCLKFSHIRNKQRITKKFDISLPFSSDFDRPLKRDKMSLVVPEKFQHILRVMNTNIDGRRKIMFAMTSIKGESAAALVSW